MMNFRDMEINPATAEETKECADPRGMRKRIELYARSDSLTRSILDASRYHGLSGEDMMTWLAFEALRRLEKLTDDEIKHARVSVQRPIIYVDADVLRDAAGHPRSEEPK